MSILSRKFRELIQLKPRSAAPADMEKGDIYVLDGSPAKIQFHNGNDEVEVITTTTAVLGPTPALATDNALVRWDGTGGRLTQNSLLVVDDSGNMTGLVGLTMTGAISGTTSMTMTGAISGATNIAMTGALSGATTIDASGTITGGNLTTAGNLTLSGLTQGSVLHVGAAGLIQEANSTFFFDGSNTRLGLGLAASTNTITLDDDISSDVVNGTLVIKREGDDDDYVTLGQKFSDVAAEGASILLTRARGTQASPAVVQAGDVIGEIEVAAFDGVEYGIAGNLQFLADFTPAADDTPSEFRVNLSPTNQQGAGQICLALESNGAIYVNQSTGSNNGMFRLAATVGGKRQLSPAALTDDGSHSYHAADNRKHYWGAGNDAAIYFDGTNMVIDPAEVGSGGIQIGSTGFVINELASATLADNQATAADVFTMAHASYDAAVVEYSITRGAGNREVGELYLVTDGSTADVVAASATIGTLGVTFSADVSGADVRLRYTTTSTGTAATMKYVLKKWQA